MAKKSFVLHKDSLEILEELNNEQAGILFKAISNYNSNKELPEMDFAIKIAFIPFKNQFERDNEAYEKKCKINRENGKQGGRPKENQKKPKKPKETEKTQTVIPEYSEFQQYALSKAKDIDLEKLQIKYEAWKENGWKDGHNKPIKNWKSKLLQTLQYLKSNGTSKQITGNSQNRTSATYDRSQAISEAQTLFGKSNRAKED